MNASIPLEAIQDKAIQKNGIRLFVLRTDLNHPFISGNKLFKLKYNLEEAKKQGYRSILTFGGAFSNHIAATAAAGHEHGFQTLGIIRGEEISNPTLDLARKNGMQLHFVSRELYRDKAALYRFAESLGHHFMIPEGGANEAGVRGCMEITAAIGLPFDHICCACGTGSTLAGIVLSLNEAQKATGFQILKGENYIRNEVRRWLAHFGSQQSNWEMNEDYHFGGYARFNRDLLNFIRTFEDRHGIPLDQIYTGKMMFGIYDLMEKNYFKKGETVIAVHTGGLQGRLPAGSAI